MNGLDLVLVAVVGLAATGGYHLGLVTRGVSWVALVSGVAIMLALTPVVLRPVVASSTPGETFFAAVGLLLIGGLLGQALGLAAGSRLSAKVRSETGRRWDQRAGAVAGMLGVVLLVWILVPVMAAVPGRTASVTRGSFVVRGVADGLPAAPDVTRRLRELVRSGTPAVVDGVHPTSAAGPVPATPGLSAAMIRKVSASVVRIEGNACAMIQEGTGFVLERGKVVTNAHVVAGEDQITVVTSDGRRHRATLTAFDGVLDLAELSVPGMVAPPLETAPADVGTVGGVFGHPRGGELRVSPFRVADAIVADGRDIHDREKVTRPVLVLAADLEPGDSGSPLVRPDGRVVGMAFAVAPDRAGVAYGFTTKLLEGIVGTVGAVDAGRCVG